MARHGDIAGPGTGPVVQESLTLDEIMAVRLHIGEALAGSSLQSTLPAEEQDKLLAQACAEACSILDRWVNGSVWKEVRPVGRGPIADVIPDWEPLKPFLESLGATLRRLGVRRPGAFELPEIADPQTYINEWIEKAESTAKRYPRFDRAELFNQATDRIKALQAGVCAAAADFAKGTKSRARRRAFARSVLKHVGGFLLSASLILVGVTPQALAHDIPGWGHEAVNVLFVHQAAQSAQPGVRVAPPQLGPHLG